MSDVQYWEDQLTDSVGTLQELLEHLPALTAQSEKNALLMKIEKRLKSAMGAKRTFKMETHMVTDSKTRKQYETKLSKLEQQLASISMDVKAIKAEQERKELLASGGSDMEATEEDYEKAGDSLLNEANQIQEKTQDSLTRTKQMVAETKDIGLATLEELERQREVLQNVDKETDRIIDNLSRAEALIKQFAKGVATDKFIQCFAVVNFLLLIGVIVYSVVKKPTITPMGNGDADEDIPQPAERRLLLSLHSFLRSRN